MAERNVQSVYRRDESVAHHEARRSKDEAHVHLEQSIDFSGTVDLGAAKSGEIL